MACNLIRAIFVLFFFSFFLYCFVRLNVFINKLLEQRLTVFHVNITRLHSNILQLNRVFLYTPYLFIYSIRHQILMNEHKTTRC